MRGTSESDASLLKKCVFAVEQCLILRERFSTVSFSYSLSNNSTQYQKELLRKLLLILGGVVGKDVRE